LCWQVKKDEYDEFFKLTFKEFLEPLAKSHFNVEGTIEFRALMFVPGMAPFEQQASNLFEQPDLCAHYSLPPASRYMPIEHVAGAQLWLTQSHGTSLLPCPATAVASSGMPRQPKVLSNLPSQAKVCSSSI
jgi:Hsp90 protein